MRKIIQIAFDTSGDVSTDRCGDTEGSITSDLWALCSDGTLWCLAHGKSNQVWHWHYVDHPIPQTSLEELQAATVKA